MIKPITSSLFKLMITSLLGGILVCHGNGLLYAQGTIDSPQLEMISARAMSLGRTNPTLHGDIGSLFINPAVVGNPNMQPFSFTSESLLGQFDYKSLHTSFPIELPIPINGSFENHKLNLGLSYGGSGLSGIPETTSDNNVIRQIGTYGSGFNVFQGTLGTEVYDIFGFQTLSVGTSMKYLQQYIKNDSRSSVALDFGAIGTYYIEDSDIFDRVHLGGSVLNFFSTPMRWEVENENREDNLPIQIFLGVKADMFHDKLSLFANNTIDSLAFGGEYHFQKNFILRGSSDFKTTSFGTGLIFEKVAGFLNENLSLRLDYNLSIHPEPFSSNLSHAISMTILGSARPNKPKILYPDPREKISTQNRRVNLVGIGPKNTTMRIYNNGSLIRTTQSNRFGKWTFNQLPLKEGDNKVYVSAYSLEEDESLTSDTLAIYTDTSPPELNVNIIPMANELKLTVLTEDKLAKISATIDTTTIEFKKQPQGLSDAKNTWVATIPYPGNLKPGGAIPETLSELKLQAVDLAGNESKAMSQEFFATLLTPKDKHIHYKEELRFIGKASSLVKRILIGGKPVYIDSNYNYSISLPLDPGKNTIPFTIVPMEGQELTYQLQSLRLKDFADLTNTTKEKRDIQFMATLGILDGESDGSFLPDKPVTRRYILRTIAKAINVKLPTVTNDLFSDVSKNDPDAPYILMALRNGYVFAFADGTFKPDQPLTYRDVISLLNRAGVTNEAVPTVGGNQVMLRKDLATFLASLPEFEFRITQMINWN